MNQYHTLYRSFPSQPFDDMVRVSLDGASYHFDCLNEYMSRPGMQQAWDQFREANPQLQDDINKFYWHLRGFFWELIATFDTLLQWANYSYKLISNEKDVTWKNIKQNANKNRTDQWKQTYESLNDIHESEWFFEVNAYRNFSHRNHLSSLSAHNEARMLHLSLLPVREGQNQYIPIDVQLNNYGLKMTELVNLILPASAA